MNWYLVKKAEDRVESGRICFEVKVAETLAKKIDGAVEVWTYEAEARSRAEWAIEKIKECWERHYDDTADLETACFQILYEIAEHVKPLHVKPLAEVQSMTYKEALGMGYRDADTAYQRGYVSRKTDVKEQEVLTAGGRRKGERYILVPCWESTEYCVRQYLTKD